MAPTDSSTARPRRSLSKSDAELAPGPAPSVSVQYSSGKVTGWVSLLPSSWVPYVQLARLSLPAALILIYIPTLSGVLLAAILARRGGGGSSSDVHFPASWWYTCIILLIGSFFFSNAAHAWDDLADAPIDMLIARTARRPIPRGAVSRPAAFAFVVANALGAAAVLLLGFPDPAAALRYALPNVLATAYYPYAKRHTYVPQLVLGFCIAWGAVMGALAVGCEPFTLGSTHSVLRLALDTPLLLLTATTTTSTAAAAARPIPATLTLGPLTVSTPFLGLFTALTLWSAIYDTIYAAEDFEADVRLGLGSLAVLFGLRHTKTALYALLACLVAGLVVCGLSAGVQAAAFYVLAPGGCALALGAMVASVDLRDARSTWWWFMYGYWLVGGAILGGLGVELVTRMGGVGF